MLQELLDHMVVLLHVSLAWKTLLTFSVMSLELLMHLNFFTPTSIASFSPAMRALHSSWLFEDFQSKFTNCSIMTLFGPSRVTPIVALSIEGFVHIQRPPAFTVVLGKGELD